MKVDMHTYAERFILEDEVLARARARGVEVGATNISSGTGAFDRAGVPSAKVEKTSR